MEAKTAGYILHSAEHMFARALQNMGLVINVLKADTFREDGRGIVFEGGYALTRIQYKNTAGE